MMMMMMIMVTVKKKGSSYRWLGPFAHVDGEPTV